MSSFPSVFVFISIWFSFPLGAVLGINVEGKEEGGRGEGKVRLKNIIAKKR